MGSEFKMVQVTNILMKVEFVQKSGWSHSVIIHRQIEKSRRTKRLDTHLSNYVAVLNEQLFLEIDVNHIDAYLGCRFITMDMQVQESVTILDSSPSSKTNSTRQVLSLTIIQRA